MSVHEIVQMYKEAKDKNAQIEILADLNACSKNEILMILQNEGLISGVKATKKTTPKTTRMVWNEEAKETVRKLLAEGLTILEVSERMGLDFSQVRNAITRFKLREKKEDGTNNPSVGKADSSRCTEEPVESAEDKVEPLGVVSLIRDYAKCITSLPSADIRNYEKIVRTFAESIIEGADSILREAEEYGA